jgi:hypothetical protein
MIPRYENVPTEILPFCSLFYLACSLLWGGVILSLVALIDLDDLKLEDAAEFNSSFCT